MSMSVSNEKVPRKFCAPNRCPFYYINIINQWNFSISQIENQFAKKKCMTWIELGKVMWPTNVGGTPSLCIERRKPISTNYCECSAISTNDSQRIIKVAECESIWYQSTKVAFGKRCVLCSHSILLVVCIAYTIHIYLLTYFFFNKKLSNALDTHYVHSIRWLAKTLVVSTCAANNEHTF